jgi:large subunit ribosomal protein L4
MAKALNYSKTGSKKEAEITLNKQVFDVTPNHQLVDLAYRAYLATGRAVSATTLQRGEVRGGGRKPWRQKGTGRARVGSIRVPNWRGGGVIFGPRGNENYGLTMSVKSKREALRQALSLQATDKKIIVLEGFTSADGKVKEVTNLLGKLKVEGNILLAVENKDAMIDRATRNISGLITVQAKYLNVFNVLNADAIIITQKALDEISSWLGEAKEAQAEPKAETKKEAVNA